MCNCVGFLHIRSQFTLEALERDTGVTSDNITTLVFCIPGVAHPTTSITHPFVRTCDPKTLGDLQFESWGWRDFFPYFGPFSVTPYQSVSQVTRSKSLKLG